MLPSYLRLSYQYCLRYHSDMRTEVARNKGHLSLNRCHACEIDLVQLCRHACSKDLRYFLLHVLICLHSITGTTSSYVTGSLAAYENQAYHGQPTVIYGKMTSSF